VFRTFLDRTFFPDRCGWGSVARIPVSTIVARGQRSLAEAPMSEALRIHRLLWSLIVAGLIPSFVCSPGGSAEAAEAVDGTASGASGGTAATSGAAATSPTQSRPQDQDEQRVLADYLASELANRGGGFYETILALENVLAMRLLPLTETSPRVQVLERFVNQSGQPCQDYLQTAEIKGMSVQARGVACRQPDGSWQVMSPSAASRTPPTGTAGGSGPAKP